VKFTGKADFAEAKSVPKLRGLLPHLENSYTIKRNMLALTLLKGGFVLISLRQRTM